MTTNATVTINVGGSLFIFNRQTLAMAPDGLLLHVFGPDSERFGGATAVDGAGNPYFEWDGADFAVVATFLRTGTALLRPADDMLRAKRALDYFFTIPPIPTTPAMVKFSTTLAASMFHCVLENVQRVLNIARRNCRQFPSFRRNYSESALHTLDASTTVEVPVFSDEGGTTMQVQYEVVMREVEKRLVARKTTATLQLSTASNPRIPVCEGARFVCRYLIDAFNQTQSEIGHADVVAWLRAESDATDVHVLCSETIVDVCGSSVPISQIEVILHFIEPELERPVLRKRLRFDD